MEIDTAWSIISHLSLIYKDLFLRYNLFTPFIG